MATARVSKLITEARMADEDVVTVGVLRQVIAEVIAASEERMVSRMAEAIGASEERMTSRITDVETKLLSEFYKWARPMNGRLIEIARSNPAA